MSTVVGKHILTSASENIFVLLLDFLVLCRRKSNVSFFSDIIFPFTGFNIQRWSFENGKRKSFAQFIHWVTQFSTFYFCTPPQMIWFGLSWDFQFQLWVQPKIMQHLWMICSLFLHDPFLSSGRLISCLILVSSLFSDKLRTEKLWSFICWIEIIIHQDS